MIARVRLRTNLVLLIFGYLAVERNVKRHRVQLFQTLKNIAGAAGPAFKRYIDMFFRLGGAEKFDL